MKLTLASSSSTAGRRSPRPRGRALAAVLLIAPIRLYQLLLSPLVGPVCRYQPSCSHYAIEALRRHGPAHGLALALRRLARCHPLGGSGYDPVPPAPAPASRI